MIGMIGAGGHAKVITELFLSVSAKTKLVFFSPNPNEYSPFFERFDHYEDRLDILLRASKKIHSWHVAIGNIEVRKKKITSLMQLNYRMAKAIHPAATLSRSSVIGEGSSVMAGCIINSESVIGQGSIVNTGAIIDHDCLIGNFTNIGPGCRLAGGVTIGAETELGTGTIVIPNITIGKNCVIGAGSVVIRDIPDGSRAVGVPAKRINP